MLITNGILFFIELKLFPLTNLESQNVNINQGNFAEAFSNPCQTSMKKYFAKKKQLTIRNTVQKLKFSIKDFFSKCDQIRR